MSNRLVSYTQDVILGLFKDHRWMYPSEREWTRDLSRLLLVQGSRGFKCLAIDFPAFLKHFDQCLDVGTYTNPHMPFSRPKRRGEQVPVFLRELFLRIFDTEGKLLDVPCPSAILGIRTVFGTFKKIELECERSAVRNEVDNFFSVDAALPLPSLNWDLDELFDVGPQGQGGLVGSLHVRDLKPADLPLFGIATAVPEWVEHLQRCFDIVASEYGLAPHLRGEGSHTHSRPRNGPGAVAEMSKGNSKYEFPYWPSKLQHLFPRDVYALPSLGWGFSRAGESCGYLGNTEHPSRLIAVPKTLKAPRLIAAEPSSHMWIQQLLWQELEALTASSSLGKMIKFRDQTRNGDFALRGSRGGFLATLDLSEASDRLSCALIERFWRKNPGWLESLHAVRTRSVSYMDDGQPRYAKLRKFAPMGSAVTFPLQSVVFCTIACAAVLWTKGKQPTGRAIRGVSQSVSVFGDDIAVSKDATRVLIEMLEFSGLKVNTSKTFTGSNFRESCGVDAFRGVVVTPPRLLAIPNGRLSAVPSLVETSNNFFKAGYWNTARVVERYVRKWKSLIPITSHYRGCLSFYSYSGDKVDHLKSRYNPDLQSLEFRRLSVRVLEEEGEMSGSARLLSYFTERPSPLSKWASKHVSHRLIKYQPGWGLLQ